MQVSDLYNNDNKFVQTMAISATWFDVYAAGVDLQFRHDYYCKNLLPIYTDIAEVVADVQTFLNSNAYKIEGLYQSTIQEYSMIENYDMEETQTNTGNVTTNSSTTAGTTMTNNVSTYDNDTLRTSGNTVNSGTDTATATVADTTGHTLRRHGNIGVTTSQQMILSERELINVEFCKIVSDMINEFICEMRW